MTGRERWEIPLWTCSNPQCGRRFGKATARLTYPLPTPEQVATGVTKSLQFLCPSCGSKPKRVDP